MNSKIVVFAGTWEGSIFDSDAAIFKRVTRNLQWGDATGV